MIIWGISANSHDAAISVVRDSNILFASQSERYSKIKNDAHLHVDLIRNAMTHGIPELVVWYENPLLKTARQFIAGQGIRLFENYIKGYLKSYNITAPIEYVGHHHAHAAGGYFTSPFVRTTNEAAVLVIDAIGEFDTTTIWHGQGNTLTKKHSIRYPHS